METMVPAPMLLPLLLAVAPPAAMAGMNHAPPACPAGRIAPPAGLEAWARPAPVRAGGVAARAPVLSIGRAAAATLLPTPEVAYPVPPAKPGGAESSGGLFAFAVAAAGRYRVALGSGAWIDVLAGAVPAASIAHSHGPDCTGIRKMVEFDLKPGRYLLQVAGAAAPMLSLMVARMP